jgi:sugar porter (SP) family MFS transporter
MRAAVAGPAVVARATPRTSPRAETHRRREPLPLVRASTAGKFQQRRRRTRVDALTTRASTRRRAEDGPIASIDAPRSRAVAAMASASASASASDGDSAAFSRELFGNVTAEEGARALYRCTLTVCLAMLSVGCACGAIAGALVYIESGTILGTLTTTMKGAVVAALPLGAMFGCAATPALNEPFGRRFALAVCDVGFIVSALLMATATSINQVILGRFVAGLAVGTATSMCTVYISECAPAKTRGKHSGLAPLSVTIGLLTSFIVSLLATGLADGWRFMFAAAALPALAQLAIMRFTRWLPESPRWLAENCRVGDAKAVLNSLGQPDVDVHVIALNATTRPSMKILTLFKDAKTRDALGVASLMNFFQQACGINVVIYYAPKILNDIGFDRSHAIALTACVSVIQILAGTWLSRTVDSVGRRPMAIGGIGVISFALGLLTLSVTPSVYSYFMSATAAPWLAVVAILLFRIAFSVSLGPMPYIVTSEVFPQKVRNVGVSAATGVQWVMNALVTFTFLRIREIWSAQGVWMLYFAVSLCALVVVYKVLPETSGKSLEAN